MDLEDLQAQAATHEARQARIRDLEESSAATRRDMAERQARRDAGEEPVEWRRPEPAVPRMVPPQQAQASSMDAVNAANWNKWCKAHIANALRKNDATLMKAVGEGMARYVGKKMEGMAGVIGGEVGKTERKLRDDMDAQVKTIAHILTRLMALEAKAAGRSLSRIPSRAGAHHANA